MGTKMKPGKFDCYANAEANEPMFILLARDRHAPTLVEMWADLREKEGEDPAKVAEARECAAAMRAWKATQRVPLFVFTASEEEWVIAASPEDAAKVYEEMAHSPLVFDEAEGPAEWTKLPDDKMLSMRDEERGTEKKTCAEWVRSRGRSYLGSANA